MDSKKIKNIIILLLALGIIFISIRFKSPSRQIRPARNNRLSQFIKQNPELEPMYKEMLKDGILTSEEIEKLSNAAKK